MLPIKSDWLVIHWADPAHIVAGVAVAVDSQSSEIGVPLSSAKVGTLRPHSIDFVWALLERWKGGGG